VRAIKILAFDASGKSISAAALEGARILAESFENTGLNHSVRLLPMISAVLDSVGWKVRDLDRIAVVAGPGSFTGVRICVSTARALAQPFEIPCAAVNSLETLACANTFIGIVCPMLDARAGQVYASAYMFPEGERIIGDTAVHIDEYLDTLKAVARRERILFCGDAITFRDKILTAFPNALFSTAPLRASAAGIIAAERAPVRFDEILPIYLRKPQAERLADNQT
jgi:tRNA threonylcarbamoyladenosine biosynthesis protein TsaB